MADGKRVVVIGAGIVGVSSALWLQRLGHRVTVVDRQGPASGTSHGNAGVLAACSVVPVTVPGLVRKAPKMLFDSNSPLFLRWAYLLRLLPWLRPYLRHCNPDDVRRIARALTPILGDSLQQHQTLAEGTPAADYIEPTDYWFVYQNREVYEAEKFVWDVRRECGYQWEELERDAMLSRDPAFEKGDAQFAVAIGNHGFISDPGEYVKALAGHFQSLGGELQIGTVQDLVARDGRISEVVLSDSRIACDAAIVATGIWSTDLSEKLGIKVPMEAERGYHVELYDASIVPKYPSMIASGKFVTTPMRGRLRCAGIVEFGGLSSLRSRKALDLLMRQVQAVFPGISYDRVEEWLGYRPAPTDSIPVIGEFPQMSGVYAGFGHHHVGLTGGAKTGRVLADLISGVDPGIDMTPYRVNRFMVGQPMN